MKVEIYLNFLQTVNQTILFLGSVYAMLIFTHGKYKSYVRKTVLKDLLSEIRIKANKELEQLIIEIEMERKAQLSTLERIVQGE